MIPPRAWVLAVMLLGLAGPALSGSPSDPASGNEPKSLKERLSDKASDEQRVNNCRVPLDRRGTKPRPGCPTEVTPSQPARTASPTQ